MIDQSALYEQRVTIRDDSDLVIARQRIREIGARVGLPESAIEAIATAATEIARNIVIHAHRGELVIGAITQSDRSGLEVIARDDGPGIADVGAAMTDGYSTKGSLGLGLPSARRLVDEFEIQTRIGAGTTVVLRKLSRCEGRR